MAGVVWTRSEDLLTMNLRPADIPLSDWNVPVDRATFGQTGSWGGGARRRRFEPGRAPSGESRPGKTGARPPSTRIRIGLLPRLAEGEAALGRDTWLPLEASP